MPAPTVSTAPDRAELRSRLLAAQFWVGIALAPVAALLLILGGTTAAALLAIVAVVVLGLSVMLRTDPSPTPRAGDVTVDDMNALRDDVRADITTAARATHRALSEKMSRLEESVAAVHRLEESVAGMRRLEELVAGVKRQVEAARAIAVEARDAADNRPELSLPPRPPAIAVGSVPGVVRHTQTVVTRSMYVDQPAEELEPARSGSTVYGSASRAGSRAASPTASSSAAARAAIDGTVSGSTTYGSATRRSAAPAGDSGWDEPERRDRADRADRVDRVDRADRVDRVDERGGRRRDVDRRDSEEDVGSWTEQRLRAYLPQSRESFDRIAGRGDDPTDSSGDLANDARWSRMRDGDRWAEVRADDHGRELRMAERREERRVDETGTQLRIVDRWSTVREERFPPSDRAPARETRAERRRRAEAETHVDADADADRYEPARPALPRPRQATDVRPERFDDNGRGWRDVRSGVVEPDHSDGYGVPDYGHSARDQSAYDQPAYDQPAYDQPNYGAPNFEAPVHNDVGVYRRSSGERPASRPPAPADARSDAWVDDPYASRPTNGFAGRRDSGDFPPVRRPEPAGRRDSGDFPPVRRPEPAARRDSGDFPPVRRPEPAGRRDSGDFPPVRRPEPAAYDNGDDRDDHWIREPGRPSTGHRPRLDFEPTDDRWR